MERSHNRLVRSVLIPLLSAVVLSLSFSCRQAAIPALSISVESSIREDGKTIELFRMTNANGMTVKVTNYAASLTYVSAPDKEGHFEPVVLGFDSLRRYLGRHPKFGATVGRYANRIKNAQFRLGDRLWHLEKNNKQHSIHGGTQGFNRRIFETDTFYVCRDTAIIVFKYRSAHMEGGFPGNLDFRVAYKLTRRNEVILEYTATTDKPTVVNFTNHSYFNLTGCKAPVCGHLYKIEADSVTPVDSTGIPTGELMPVAGTEYDFSVLRNVERQIRKSGKGYDINYKLNKCASSPRLAATVVDSVSGRVLKAYTTEPGMQFYIPHSNMDYLVGHDDRPYGKFYGFCLEMQHFPDSPHHPHFPTTVLRPGETYRQTTIYRFETL